MNNADTHKARTEKATVRILGRNDQDAIVPIAQGVLVPGGYIITAAHCINWKGTGAMALGDWFIETIQASDGTQYKVSPCAVELLTDIAVLAAVDGQEMSAECEAFEEFCEATEPVRVSADDLPGAKIKNRRVPKGSLLQIPRVDYKDPPLIPVHVLTHKGKWITGNAQRFGLSPPGGSVCVTFDALIEGGTSGSPVIDDKGLLVGVISHSSGDLKGDPKACNGLIPRPHLALPAWIWNRINRPK